MNSQRRVVSVVGPTASGKTKRALKIAKQAIADGRVTGVDLISVDSRQVYQGLEVLTGADVPKGFKRKILEKKIWAKYLSSEESMFERGDSERVRTTVREMYFAPKNDSIRLFGVSMIQPSHEWSVAHFQQYARVIMIDSWSNNRLPILVGGTGLYHQELFRQDHKLHIPPNEEVRKKAEHMTVEDLQKWLKEVDRERLVSMNESDRGNPRRLVRAIEVGLVEKEIMRDTSRVGKEQIANEYSEENSWKILDQVQDDEFVGSSEIVDQVRNDDKQVQHDWSIDWSRIKPEIVFVTADLDLIKKKIEKRVKERYENGAIDEVKRLLSLDLSPTLPVMSTLGVPEITKFLQGETSAEECQKLWSLHEFQYAKRQLTWWKDRTKQIFF